MHVDSSTAEKRPQRMEFWHKVPWRALHDPVRAIEQIPAAIRSAIADLRGSIAAAANGAANVIAEDRSVKCFCFLDRLLFAAARKQREHARGQHGETLSRTIARRVRMA